MAMFSQVCNRGTFKPSWESTWFLLKLSQMPTFHTPCAPPSFQDLGQVKPGTTQTSPFPSPFADVLFWTQEVLRVYSWVCAQEANAGQPRAKQEPFYLLFHFQVTVPAVRGALCSL